MKMLRDWRVLAAVLVFLAVYASLFNAYLLETSPNIVCELSDLVFLFFSLSLFIASLKVKGKARNKLVWGAGLLCLGRFMEMPLKQAKMYALVLDGNLICLPALLLTFLGFLLLLLFMEERVK